MPENRTPRNGQVYRSPSGMPMLYVRTEQRPGATQPEHLFIEARDRVVYQRWMAEVPEEWELALDPDATARADRVECEMTWVQRERDALVAAMKYAVPLVPVAVASELRRVYREELLSAA